MIEFWMGAVLLLGLAAVFLLFPAVFLRRRQVVSQSQSNRDWFERRKLELMVEKGAADLDLLEDAQLRLLQDSEEQGERPVVTGAGSKPLPLALGLLLLLLLLAVTGYRQLGAAPDVRLAQTLQGFPMTALKRTTGR